MYIGFPLRWGLYIGFPLRRGLYIGFPLRRGLSNGLFPNHNDAPQYHQWFEGPSGCRPGDGNKLAFNVKRTARPAYSHHHVFAWTTNQRAFNWRPWVEWNTPIIHSFPVIFLSFLFIIIKTTLPDITTYTSPKCMLTHLLHTPCLH
jgi:hypothetical protein